MDVTFHTNCLFSYIISNLFIYIFAGLRAFIAVVTSQAGDVDSSWAPGLTSGSWTEPGVLGCRLWFTTAYTKVMMFWFFNVLEPVEAKMTRK